MLRLPSITQLPTLFPLSCKIPITKTLSSISGRMSSSWACSTCTFLNPPAQKLHCQICHTVPLQLQSLATSPSSSSVPQPKWSCSACTFSNPYQSKVCEMCDTRASASLRPILELDQDDLDRASVDSSIGTVFLPLLRACSNNGKGIAETLDLTSSGNGTFGNSNAKIVGVGEKKGSWGLRPCSNKRKVREVDDFDLDGNDDADTDGFVEVAEKAVVSNNLAGQTPKASASRTWKILSYNIWFREDLEMHSRMRALGNLIQLHLPDVMCFQEVTPEFYNIFKRSSWWKGYRCSISSEKEFPGGYFCMQLSKLPVKSYSCKPFDNSIMGRQLCIAEVEVLPDTPLVVATSHLESPCPAPPKWDQMFSKERVVQAKEAVRFLDKNPNAIFCGDMNWDDKRDGLFPSPAGWEDAWTELRPGEVGFTYDTKSNKMISGNKSLQKRLDRFMCKLKNFKISKIEMIGMDAIPGLSYVKEKKVRGQVKELELPVYPSDHYGLLLTICSSASD